MILFWSSVKSSAQVGHARSAREPRQRRQRRSGRRRRRRGGLRSNKGHPTSSVTRIGQFLGSVVFANGTRDESASGAFSSQELISTSSSSGLLGERGLVSGPPSTTVAPRTLSFDTWTKTWVMLYVVKSTPYVRVPPAPLSDGERSLVFITSAASVPSLAAAGGLQRSPCHPGGRGRVGCVYRWGPGRGGSAFPKHMYVCMYVYGVSVSSLWRNAGRNHDTLHIYSWTDRIGSKVLG